MKVAVIFLDYHRHDYTSRTLESLHNGGYPFDLFTINRKGIAAAINEGLDKAWNYDAVVTCANDILMPDNWLKTMVGYVSSIPNTGMCGIHCVEGAGSPENINGVLVNKTFTAFGNVMIPATAFKNIGYFSEEFDPYGMQDSDYGYRLNKSGFVNYYIPSITSNHIGHDVGQETDYRKMKDEGLNKAQDVWNKLTAWYDSTNNYKRLQR